MPSDQDKLWEVYQTDPELVKSFKATPRFRFILKKIPVGSRVLNVGIGDGEFEELCAAKGVDFFSLDPSEETVGNLRKKLGCGAERIKAGRCEKLPFDEKIFDFVVFSEVLEHLESHALAESLREANRVLKDGGELLGTSPADEDLSSGQVVCIHCGKRFHRWGHFQSFSEEKLREILSPHFNGVKIKRVYFSDTRYLNWKGKLMYFFKKALMSFGVHGQNESYFFKAIKR